MEHKKNPYDWQSDRPKHVVPRGPLLTKVVDQIRKGTNGYLVGCRGMGKSAFLDQLKHALPSNELDILIFTAPRSPKTVTRAFQAIADAMVLVGERRNLPQSFRDALREHAKEHRLPELFDTYLQEKPAYIERLVLLYDELDAYAEPPELGKHFFNDLEDVKKKSQGQIVVFAAGGLGLVALDTVLGSSFFSRLVPDILEPFSMDDLTQLGEEFDARGTPLSKEVVEALLLATGGNPALATYGLQSLWSKEQPSPRDVVEVLGAFRESQAHFLQDIRGPVFDLDVSDAPERVWRELQRSNGRMTGRSLKELLRAAKGKQRFREPRWIFSMLRSTGLIRAPENAYVQAHIEVEIIPSILTLGVEEKIQQESLREQLVADLRDALASIHRMSADFFRSDHKDQKHIVPEAVFSAAIILALEPRGWRAEREAQSAAGRTDIKARHVDAKFGDRAVIIEIKVWGRNDYEDIHAQVTGYWSDGVDALATVMVADLLDAEDWSHTYQEKCLANKVPRHEQRDAPSALAGHFVALTTGCPVVEVDHFLLRLAKRI